MSSHVTLVVLHNQVINGPIKIKDHFNRDVLLTVTTCKKGDVIDKLNFQNQLLHEEINALKKQIRDIKRAENDL